jgi:magnesium-transporting ATPase (P-type)
MAGGLGDPALQDARDVARALEADLERGLSPQEAARWPAASSRNELRAKPRVPRWRRFLGQFRDPLIYLLLAAVAISLAAWAIEGEGWPVDAIVITLIVVLNGILSYVQEARAEDAVAALYIFRAACSRATAASTRRARPVSRCSCSRSSSTVSTPARRRAARFVTCS